MDQLHEELKEPVVVAAATLTEARDSDLSDTEEKREGDRSPSEDEFLSCDSSSSDRGEGDGQGRGGGGSQAEAELLPADEAGRAISEKERMKDRKFSWGQQRTSSEQVDEDADVDTAMATLDHRPAEARPPSPRSTSPCRTPGTSSCSGHHSRSTTRTLGAPPPWGFCHETQLLGERWAEYQVRTPYADKAGVGFRAWSPEPCLQMSRGWALTGTHGGSGLGPFRRCQRVLFLIRPWSWLGCLAQHGPSAPRARQ